MGPRGLKRWLPLEANPDVIEKYARDLGGPESLKFCDILSTDDWALEMVPQPVVGVLLLFPMKAEGERIRKERREAALAKGEQSLKEIWFTHQTVRNACGTVAVLHVLANIVDRTDCGDAGFLRKFLREVEGKGAAEIGKALEDNQEIEQAHADVEREGQSAVPSREEEVDNHFLAFVEINGRLVELDGDKDRPFVHGSTTKETFLKDTVSVVKEHFIDIDPKEMRFQLIGASLLGKE